MKLKLFLLTMLMGIFMAGMGQSFFKSLPKHTVTVSKAMRAPSQYDSIIVAPAVTTMTAIRPVASIAAYSEPGHILMAGAGISYESLKFDVVADKWKSVWSVSALIFGGGGINPSGPDTPSFVTYGILVGFFNNIINIGPTYNYGSKKVGIAIGIGINLNN